MTRVTVSHEFELEVRITRSYKLDGFEVVTVWVTEVDSDGGLWHYPKDLDDDPEVYVEFAAEDVEGLTHEQIIAKAQIQG